MKISKEYGPQLDASNGTCGDVKLVKRYIIVDGKGNPWQPRQGRYTYPHEDSVKHHINQIKMNNSVGAYPVGIQTAAWWCWPAHHDPAMSVEMDCPKCKKNKVHDTEVICNQCADELEYLADESRNLGGTPIL